MLAKVNAHPRDTAITFQEEGHIYTLTDVNGNKVNPISTTTLIHSLFPHFDADVVIDRMFKSGTAQQRYPGMTKEEIKVKWKKNGEEASSLGTTMHNDIEDFLNGKNVVNDTVEYGYFQRFWQQFTTKYPTFRPYRTEWLIYDEFAKVSGSIDFTVATNSGDLVLIDWKRSKEIKMKNRYEKGRGIFCSLDHCNYNHYMLQLNVYRHILETRYGQRVIFMMLVVMHPNQDSYECIIVPRQEGLINELWRHRHSNIN